MKRQSSSSDERPPLHYERPAAAAPFAASHIPGRHTPCTLLFTVNFRPFFTGPPPCFPFSLNM